MSYLMYALVLRRYKTVLNATYPSPEHFLSWWRLHPQASPQYGSKHTLFYSLLETVY